MTRTGKLEQCTDFSEEVQVSVQPMCGIERDLARFFFTHRASLPEGELFYQYYFLKVMDWSEFVEYFPDRHEFLRITAGCTETEELSCALMLKLVPTYRYMKVEHDNGRRVYYDEEEIEVLASYLRKAVMESIYEDLNECSPMVRSRAQVNALRLTAAQRSVPQRCEEYTGLGEDE